MSRLSGLVVVSGDGGGRPADLVVEMERIPLAGREMMALELVETDSGVVATAQIATGDLQGGLRNLEIAQRNMPFLRRDISVLRHRMEAERGG